MIEQAFNTALFTDLDGNITSLEEAMLKFAEDSGEAVGILADKVKNELSESLKALIYSYLFLYTYSSKNHKQTHFFFFFSAAIN